MFLSFQDWQDLMLGQTPNNKKMSCPCCYGEGIIDEECDCCGHEREVQCELCEGSGNVRFGDLTLQWQRTCFSRATYHDALAYDIQKYTEWTGNPLNVVQYGFAIASDIRSVTYGKTNIIDLHSNLIISCVK